MKNRPSLKLRPVKAEKEGFEPPEVLPSTVFKTAAIDHSAISPLQKYHFFFSKNKKNKKSIFIV
jgi:hypothetical protein